MRGSLNKKGNMALLVPGIITLVMGAIFLVFGLVILDELFLDTATKSTIVYNETVTAAPSGVTVATAGSCGFHNFLISIATNATGGEIINSGNYTVDARLGIITPTNLVPYNTTTWNVTYSYSYSDTEACYATNSTIEGMGKFADYYDLIVLAIIIAIVISLLLVVFSLKNVK